MLDRTQAAVFKSVNLLVEGGILRAEREPNGIRRFLQLTDKGVCRVLVSTDINYEALLKNHPYLKSFTEVQVIQRLASGQELRKDIYADIAFEALLIDDFDKDYTKIEHGKDDVKHMLLILGALHASLEVKKGFEINRKEIDVYIEEIRRAMSANLQYISERLDGFQSLMEKNGYVDSPPPS